MKKFTAFIALLFMVLMVAAPAGAVTFTKLSEALMGNLRAVVYKVAFDAAYPTGGEDISQITTDNFSTVLQVVPDGDYVSGYTVAYDYDNDKLMLFLSATNELGAGAGAVNVTTRVLVIGW